MLNAQLVHDEWAGHQPTMLQLVLAEMWLQIW